MCVSGLCVFAWFGYLCEVYVFLTGLPFVATWVLSGLCLFLPGLSVLFACFCLVSVLFVSGLCFVSVSVFLSSLCFGLVCVFVWFECFCLVCVWSTLVMSGLCMVYLLCFGLVCVFVWFVYGLFVMFWSSLCFCLVWVFLSGLCVVYFGHVWFVCGLFSSIRFVCFCLVWHLFLVCACFCLVCICFCLVSVFVPGLCMFLFGSCVSAWFVCCWRGSPGWRRSVNCYQWFSQTRFCACLCKLCLMSTSGKTDIRLPPAFKGDQTATSI